MATHRVQTINRDKIRTWHVDEAGERWVEDDNGWLSIDCVPSGVPVRISSGKDGKHETVAVYNKSSRAFKACGWKAREGADEVILAFAPVCWKHIDKDGLPSGECDSRDESFSVQY